VSHEPAFIKIQIKKMKEGLSEGKRKSYMDLGEIYFWTATINQWQRLLMPDKFKDVIIQSLEYLSNAGKIDVFAFVIMPNHVHNIWRANELNGKEMPQGSFLKYTAHKFRELLYNDNRAKSSSYKIQASNKEHEFWQRDPLATLLYNKTIAFQKLDYIHRNPLAPHWRLASDPCEYTYSSAKFYEMGEKGFGFLRDLRNEF
jgi:putative transposase